MTLENRLGLDKVAQPPSQTKLPQHSVYRSVVGRREYIDFYDKVRDRLPFSTVEKSLVTPYGDTHIHLVGNPADKPLLILPGMSVCAPLMLEYFKSQAENRFLIAVDLIGQPGRSQDTPMPHKNNAYGHWLINVLDALDIKTTDIASASFGSSIALDLAQLAPERVGKMVLIAPAGLTPRIPYISMSLKLFIPWLVYRQIPIRKLLPHLAWRLSRSISEDNLAYLDLILRETAFWKHRPAGPFLKKHLKNYKNKVFLVLTGHDVLFPHRPTQKNARESLDITHEVFMEKSAHMPDETEMVEVQKRIKKFLNEA